MVKPMSGSTLLNLNHNISRFRNVNYLMENTMDRLTVQTQLTKYGYCLFRNSDLHKNIMNKNTSISTTNYLQSCLFGDNYDNKSVSYNLGTDDRTIFTNSLLNVSMTSPSLYIPYHNELIYTNEFPRILAFICLKSPKIGGQTPLTNSINVYDDMDDNMKQKFMKYGIKYIRNLKSVQNEYNKDKKTWQGLFNTNNKIEVETLCKTHYNYEFEWRLDIKDNTEILRIMYTMPAIIEYDDGIISFANSIFGFHGKYFDTGYHDYYDNIDYIDRPHHSQWGNGEEFNDLEIDIIHNLFQQNSISFDWNEGDILIIDNLTWAHSRNPFEGERQIVAMMGVPYSRQSIENQFSVTEKLIY